MKYRPLGQTGIQVSEIGLGCWQFGGDFGPVARDEADQTMSAAIAAGINFFDTADVYGAGQSEQWIGDYLRKAGKKIFVATKYGRGGGVFPAGYCLDSMRSQVLEALKRLQVPQIDLLQLHCVPTAILQQGVIFDWLRTLQQEGLVSHFGASVESVEEGLLCLQQPGITSLQVIFNIFRQKPAEELFPLALDKQVGIIVRLPLASGLLTGKLNRQTTFAETDHRHYNRDGQCFNVGETFAGLPFETAVDLVDGLRQFISQDMTMVGMSLRWILDHQAVTTVIAGARRFDQVRSNAAAADLAPLSAAVCQQLGDYYRQQVRHHIRGPY